MKGKDVTIKAIVLGLLGLSMLGLTVVVCNHLNGSTEELIMGAVATVVAVPLSLWVAVKVIKS